LKRDTIHLRREGKCGMNPRTDGSYMMNECKAIHFTLNAGLQRVRLVLFKGRINALINTDSAAHK